jgi:hypothetical protein
MKTVAAETFAAQLSAGADPATALKAAQEMGDLGHDVRVLKWMVGVVLAVAVTGFGIMISAILQIAFRLP